MESVNLMKTNRARTWTFVLYPESAPEDWLRRLRDAAVPGLVSPEHSEDVNADGSKKKPHYHVVLMYSAPHTYEQVCAVTEELHATIPQRVKDLRGIARYLCHLDNPEKHQYSTKDVVTLAGADYFALIESSADVNAAVRDMCHFAREHGITAYCDLQDYAAENRPDWFDVLVSKRTLAVSSYLKSLAWKMQQADARAVQTARQGRSWRPKDGDDKSSVKGL